MLVCVNIAKSVITIKTEVVPYEMSCHLEQITEILNETGSVITQINRQTSTLNKKRIFFGGGEWGVPHFCEYFVFWIKLSPLYHHFLLKWFVEEKYRPLSTRICIKIDMLCLGNRLTLVLAYLNECIDSFHTCILQC